MDNETRDAIMTAFKAFSTMRKSLVDTHKHVIMSGDELDNVAFTSAPAINALDDETVGETFKTALEDMAQIASCIGKAVHISEKVKSAFRILASQEGIEPELVEEEVDPQHPAPQQNVQQPAQPQQAYSQQQHAYVAQNAPVRRAAFTRNLSLLERREVARQKLMNRARRGY